MKSVYKKLVNFQQAIETALSSMEPVDELEMVDLNDSLGRILGENVYSPRNNPPFSRATMDGYAVKSRLVANASSEKPIRLKIAGESYIGEPRKIMSPEEQCFKISTGAIAPAGSDSVVKVESTEEKDGFVEIYESVGPSENIAESGSDIAEGELLLAEGKELETHDIAVLASLGISRVSVVRKLKVNVISTGNELISYNEPYTEGKINDANGVVVSSELNSFRCFDAKYSGIVKDDYGKIKEAIDLAMEDNDVIILSGGSSAGESDLVYKIIEELDPGMIFHGVLVKPGLPTVLGKSGKKVLIGLPGFPVSALMIFRSIFLIPLLRAAGSMRVPVSKSGILGVNLKLEMGKQNLIPVSVSNRDGLRIYPVTGLSGSITRFASTSGFLSIPGNTKFLEAGTQVDIILWNSEIWPGETKISGILLEGMSGGLLKPGNKWDYQRMLPRDSLRSLSNGDTDLSVFLAEKDVDLAQYSLNESGSAGVTIFRGETEELVFCSRNEIGSFPDVLEGIRSGKTAAGPAMRILKNIVSTGDTIRKIVGILGTVLTSYSAVGFDAAAESVKRGDIEFGLTTASLANKYNLKTRRICEISPVYVVSSDKTEKIKKLIVTTGLEEIRA